MGVWECFGLELNKSPVTSYLDLEERLNLPFSDKENLKSRNEKATSWNGYFVSLKDLEANLGIFVLGKL